MLGLGHRPRHLRDGPRLVLVEHLRVRGRVRVRVRVRVEVRVWG